MNKIANYIKQRLSLRAPLQDSLDIVAKLADELTLQKDADLVTELAKVNALYPTCTDFERTFPSLAFAIATGIGKTRLMGAMVAYLYLAKGVKNFFILAPGSTIYEKLIEDFGNPSFRKYVFSGIAEFVHNQPVIITGDNYAQQGNLYSESEIRINIFNIQKFNRDTKVPGRGKDKGKASKIKRLSEYLGQSYWDYLSSLDDLVILMDEAHRYHGKASKNAINELAPVLGIEMTATPIDQDGKVFKNVVFEYSLAQALSDEKYVKNPAIATRKNFKAKGLDKREIDIIKLEDAISIHQDTKIELELYSRRQNVKLVKPFVLVVCENISHAKEIYDLVSSPSFYDGEYAGKVLQIDSSTKKEDYVERQFLSLEHEDNEIEIVIHVNMLKEGWDVTNLYTIVPLRAANAAILIEQTIGRGLRLPYAGQRTGVDKIDKLTVVAHDNFTKVIEAAQDEKSILNKLTFVELDMEELAQKKQAVISPSTVDVEIEQEQATVTAIKDPKKQQEAQNVVDAKKAIIEALPVFGEDDDVRRVEDLRKPEVKKKVIQQIREQLSEGQGNMFANKIIDEAEDLYDKMVTDFKAKIIEIPRMDLVQGEVIASFNYFDLDTTSLTYKALEQEIIRMNLKDGQQVETIKSRTSGSYGNPIKLIISELINYPEIDYDDNADLLYHLATQAFEALEKTAKDKKELNLVVYQYKGQIAEKIYHQMKEHFVVTTPKHIRPNVLPFTKIEEWSFSALAKDGYKHYADIIQPRKMIPKYVFRGFEKACHFEYKFDSKGEQDLAFVLEHDKDVLKWLCPAPKQFRIYWKNNSRQYEPDFVVETANTIYIMEVKRQDQLDHESVVAKKEAAVQYCKYATEYTEQHSGKPWKYVLIPHNEVERTTSIAFLIQKHTVE